MGVYDVPPQALIESVAADLEKEFEAPAFAAYVKSGVGRERAPMRSNWFHVRSASVLYRVYRDGPLGTETLRTYYGGKKNRGRKPERFRKASGKIIRVCLQNLEKLGYVKREKKGRAMTPKGHSYLAKKAKEVGKALKLETRKAGSAMGAGDATAEKKPATENAVQGREAAAEKVTERKPFVAAAVHDKGVAGGKPAEAKPGPPTQAPREKDA